MARADESRGLRDEANVGPDPRRARELRPLKDLKWKVADGEPDIRGWSVFASTGRELGVVDDLLVDTEAGEVVMLDVDLKRDDRHTLAPLRAAWIDRGTKRVVVDARELAADPATMPTLPRRGALTDDDVSRFNDGYVRAYGDRGYDADRAYRLRHGDEELRFGAERHADRVDERYDDRSAPRRLLDETTSLPATGAAAAGGAAVGGAHAFAESDRINRELADLPRDPDRDRREREARDAALRDATIADAQRRDVERHDAERSSAERVSAERLSAERRADELREDARRLDADPMLAEREIDPRELDARVRIDEGATVDDRTPVAGVRYDSADYPRHDYGRIEDRYTGERIVSRRPWADDVADANARDAADARRAEEAERRVHYRRTGDRIDDVRP
jgi:hypothetical protein